MYKSFIIVRDLPIVYIIIHNNIQRKYTFSKLCTYIITLYYNIKINSTCPKLTFVVLKIKIAFANSLLKYFVAVLHKLNKVS